MRLAFARTAQVLMASTDRRSPMSELMRSLFRSRTRSPNERLRAVDRGTSLDELIRAAHDPCIDVARHALGWLAEQGGADERAALAQLLWRCDPALVKPVARTLVALGDHETVDVAARHLAEGPSAARSRAARVLGCFADPQSVHALRAALGDRDASVRAAALDALARFGRDPDTAAAVTLLVSDPSADVRLRAVRTLGRVVADPDASIGRAVDDTSSAVRREAAMLAARLSPERVSHLLSDRDAQVRVAAAGHAGIGAESAVIQALRTDSHPDVRQAAVETLSLFRGDATGDALVDAALGDDDAIVRAAALRAAGETLSHSRLVACMRRRLRSPDARSRAMAVRALAKLRSLIPDGEAIAIARDPDPEVRLALAQVGAFLVADPDRVFDALVEDDDPTVRHAAFVHRMRDSVRGAATLDRER
jgi:HEAT repeat protein